VISGGFAHSPIALLFSLGWKVCHSDCRASRGCAPLVCVVKQEKSRCNLDENYASWLSSRKSAVGIGLCVQQARVGLTTVPHLTRPYPAADSSRVRDGGPARLRGFCCLYILPLIFFISPPTFSPLTTYDLRRSVVSSSLVGFGLVSMPLPERLRCFSSLHCALGCRQCFPLKTTYGRPFDDSGMVELFSGWRVKAL
jgi:hypothetical protein